MLPQKPMSAAFAIAFAFAFAVPLAANSDDAVVLLQVHAKATGIGGSASLSEEGFRSVAALHDNAEMKIFIPRVIDELGLQLVDGKQDDLNEFSKWFSSGQGLPSLPKLMAQLRGLAAKGTWVKPKTLETGLHTEHKEHKKKQTPKHIRKLLATGDYSNLPSLKQATHAAKKDAKIAFRISDKDADGNLNEQEAIKAGISIEEFQNLDASRRGFITKGDVKNLAVSKAERNFHEMRVGNATANEHVISIAKAIANAEGETASGNVHQKHGAVVLVASELLKMGQTQQRGLLTSLNDTRIVLQTSSGGSRLLSAQQVAEKLDDETLAAFAGISEQAPQS